MKRALLLAALLVCAASAKADTTAYSVEQNVLGGSGLSCMTYEVCRDFATTGTCTRSGDEVVVENVGYACIQIDTMGSTATYTANLHTCRLGHDSCGVANGHAFFGTALSGSNPIAGGCGVFADMFVEVSGNAGASFDAWLTVCK